MSNNGMWQHPMPQGKTEREQQLELELEQAKAETLRQEVAKMNKEQEYWQQVRIDAAIAAMQGVVSNEIHLNHADKVAEEKGINTSTFLAKCAIDCADALVAELKRSEDVYAECRRLDSINTASVCENMTKIQKELQKKRGDQ